MNKSEKDSSNFETIIQVIKKKKRTIPQKIEDFIKQTNYGLAIVIISVILLSGFFIWLLTRLLSKTPKSLITFSQLTSNIKADSNQQLVPNFTNLTSNNMIVFGPTGFSAQDGSDISNFCFALDGAKIFDITLPVSIDDPSDLIVNLEEFCLVDVCIFYVNDKPVFSVPNPSAQDVNVGNSAGNPFIITYTGTDGTSQYSELSKNFSNTIVTKSTTIVLSGFVKGNNVIKIKYAAFGAGAIYFKLIFNSPFKTS